MQVCAWDEPTSRYTASIDDTRRAWGQVVGCWTGSGSLRATNAAGAGLVVSSSQPLATSS
jgi:hypothetical protein